MIENNPEKIHDEVLRLEDEIMPVITKIRDAVTTYDKVKTSPDEDAMDRIEALEYFKNEISPVINWVDKYMRYNEELRDIFIGSALKEKLKDILNKSQDNNEKIRSLTLKVNNLNILIAKSQNALKKSEEECEHLYGDLCNYYDKYHGITLKDWFKVRFLSKFKKSRKQ